MTEYFKAKRWAITGALKDISRRDATRALEALGASVTGSVTSKTHFLVSAGYDPAPSYYLSAKEKSARQHGIPIFNEPQLLAILAGESIEVVGELGPEVVDVPDLPVGDVLEGFRELIHDELDHKTWETVCELLDRTDDAALPVVLSYLEASLAGMRVDGEWSRHSYHPRYQSVVCADPRTLPPAWIYELLAGTNHPKFAAVVHANLQGQKIKATIAANLLAATALRNVRALNLVNNAPPAGFWIELAAAPQFSRLRYLGLGKSSFNVAAASALAQSPLSSTVTTLTIHGAKFAGDSARALFDGGWSQLRILECAGIKSPGGNLHDAVGAAEQITKLEHLIWKGVDGAQAGFGRLLSGPRFGSLRHIHLQSPLLERSSIDVITGATWLTRLERLTVIDETYAQSRASLAGLFASPQVAQLQALAATVEPEGFRALLDAHHITGLRELYVDAGRHALDGWPELLSAPQFQGLESLNIQGELPRGFMGTLAVSGRLPRLTALRVHGTGLGDEDFRQLLEAPSRLTSFEVYVDDDASKPLMREVLASGHLGDSPAASATRYTIDHR